MVTSLLLVGGSVLVAPAASGQINNQRIDNDHNGVIFVHGFDGSGAQFESQKMRFTSNGYPDGYVNVFEYDSLEFAGDIEAGGAAGAISPLQEAPLFAQLDQSVAHMKVITHRPKVDLAAHSLGTKLMQDYLNSTPQRAANIAHYVNIDGQTAKAPPGGVPTLALWATKGPLSPPGRTIQGAENVSIPDSSHVQCATSPLSFWWMYDFFNGTAPSTTQIVAQRGPITLSGRDVSFPQNDGLAGATVQVWPLDQATGHRTSSMPITSFGIDSSGDWGPVTVLSGKSYEFAELRPGYPVHHFYYEPFVRSDHLVRLLESDALRLAGGPPDPRSVAMVIIRYKELWGDQGSESDVVTANGLGICNPSTCPLSKEVNGLFAADFNHDAKSETTDTWPTYQSLGFFVSSVDLFAPAQSPPAGEVRVGIESRGSGPVRTISFPNFPSTTDVETVQFNDYEPMASACAPSC